MTMRTKLMILGIAITVIWSSCNTNKEFKEKGAKVKATVIDRLEERKSSKRSSSTKYILRINFFTNPEKIKKDSIKLAKHQDSVKKLSKMDQLLDKLTLDKDQPLIGDYQTADLFVSYDEFKKYTRGSRIEIYYMKADPKTVRLAEYVEE